MNMNFKKFIGIAIIMAVIGSFTVPQIGQVQMTVASDCPGQILVGWFSFAEWEQIKDTPGYSYHITSDWGGYVCGEIVPPPPPVCEEGEVLVDGVCVEIPPPPVECEDDEILVDGICVEPPVECDETEILVDGVCQPPPEDCERECVPPQKEDLVCINYFGDEIVEITTVGGRPVSFWYVRNPSTSETVINFDDGHLRNEPLKVILKDGEVVDMQMWAGFSVTFETWRQENCMKAEKAQSQSAPAAETGIVTVVDAAIIPGVPCPE